MKTGQMSTLILLTVCFLLTACGPSPAMLAATATQDAANLFSTQTAQAPTSTPTSTATQTPTITPTPTLTPTSTPKPTITPTATPEKMGFGLIPEDLPKGFRSMTDEELAAIVESLPTEAYVFGYANDQISQGVMGYSMPVATRTEQLTLDKILVDTLNVWASAMGATEEPDAIPGLEELGDARHGCSFVMDGSGVSLHWDLVLFRRGENAVLLFYFYPDADQPAALVGDLAGKLDGRLNQ